MGLSSDYVPIVYPPHPGAGAPTARLWKAAIMLSWELVRNPAWCAGARALELGAGVGLCGVLAAKLGAAQVTRV